MKISLIILLIGCSTYVFGQRRTSITTDEEYNYMTKGYSIQLSGGLDMKKGYEIASTTTLKEGNYEFEYIYLNKCGKDTVSVGIIVKAISTAWGKNIYWFGIPFNNTELLSKSFESIGLLDKPMTTAFFKTFAVLNTQTIVKF